MNFNSIIGQPVLVGSLKRAVQGDMVANGYIFCGPKGSGKNLVAAVFARGLNCRSQEAEKPCGSCTSCRKFESGNHPNIEVIKPTGASIKIKQIREVIAKVSKKPYESGYKVVIMDDADKMTHDAQDAFLKTLEEPPSNTIFILLVQNHNSLLPTVLSRCQVFNMRKVAIQQIERYLLEKTNFDKEQISFAAVSANGIIGRAAEVLNNKELQDLRRLYVSITTKIANNSYTELSAAAGEIVETRDDAEQLLDFLLSWYRDVLVSKQDCDKQVLVNSDNADIIARQAEKLDENKLNRIIDAIKRTISYINHNVGTKNSIDSMLLNIMEVYNG
ncbi:MAG: DNA polymerase III subunit delta' [Clostridiales bacterium GWB2_37_7]|nr:MAG: DNA polymerase III subunit delta' [Clostridiales bacterium GWB2_37_7]